MALKTFGVRERDGVFIIDLEGRIDYNRLTARAMRDAVQELISRGKGKIILNLKETIYFDCCGVGELVEAQRKAQSWWRGEVKLLNPPKQLRDVLALSKLCDRFQILDNEDEAIKSFAAPSVVKPSYRVNL